MTKQPGLTLADLASMSVDVPVGQSYITVHGISARDGLVIFQRFPALANMVNGFKLADFLKLAPDAIAAIIATATGHAGDADAEVQAGNIGIETQYDILEAVGGLTFKNGFGPFVQRIMALADAANSGNSGRVPAMKSPAPSKPSLPPDTTQK